MKVMRDREHPIDRDEIPYLDEEIYTIDEYIEFFNGKKFANDMWIFLLKCGFSPSEIDAAFLRHNLR